MFLTEGFRLDVPRAVMYLAPVQQLTWNPQVDDKACKDSVSCDAYFEDDKGNIRHGHLRDPSRGEPEMYDGS